MLRREVAMSKETMRTHVVIPKDLVASVDELVGKRARSKFFADAAAEKLARARLSRLARTVAGSLAAVDVPGWESSDAAAEWVTASRRADERHLA
jgi:metal-responsive CopG/Arc/MetJ family transcriptional regulator